MILQRLKLHIIQKRLLYRVFNTIAICVIQDSLVIDPVLEQSFQTKNEQYERKPCCLIEKAQKTKRNERNGEGRKLGNRFYFTKTYNNEG